MFAALKISLLTGTLLLGAALSAQGPEVLFSGIISDSECGLDHTPMKKQHHLPNDLVCLRECCEKYKQDYVLADHVTGEIYQIDDQKAAGRFANRHVRILGALEEKSGTIHVLKVEPVK